MPPDYTDQLKALVAALNHPTTPAWLIAVFSAILGMVGGIFAQAILLRINDRYHRDCARRVLYTDLGDNFMFIFSTLTDSYYTGDKKAAWQQDQFEKRIRFSGEEFLKKQTDIYMQLSEHRAADELYLWLHHTVDKAQMDCSNPGMFCQIFSEYVTEGFLAERRFKKYWGAERTARLMAKVGEARAEVERIKRLVADGVIKAVDGFQSDT